MSQTVSGYQYFLPVAAGGSISEDNVVATAGFQYGPTFTFQGADPNGWTSAGDAFIGVEFTLDDGSVHYGWINVEVEAGAMTVKSYAYESTPGAAIVASTDVAVEPGALAEGYEFSPIGPNPIRTSAQFSVQVAAPEHVRVAVYDLLGRDVAEVFDGELAAGVARRMEIQVGDLPAGTYVVRVTGDSFDTVRRVTVAR